MKTKFQIREILEGKNPVRTYSTGLLSRLIETGKLNHFVNDPDCMPKFFDLGYNIRNNGGVFQYSCDLGNNLQTVFLQVWHNIFFL